MGKKARVFYWADMMGDVQEEADILVAMFLENNDINFHPIEIKEYPSCLEERFDVLFFDWGGMSIGNSLMETFCKNILDSAENHPSRIYIMNSVFTKLAMEDAQYEMETDLANVFLSADDAIPLLTLWYGLAVTKK